MRCARGDRANAPSVHQPTRLHDLTASSADVRAQFRWETINAVAYKLGGLVFIIGSILFFPKAELCVGTLLFAVGSVFFLSAVGWLTAGAWTFVIGSLLFVLGACVNVLEIVRADSKLTLQLMNLTALTFVVGSVLFAVASIPYLWPAAPEPFIRSLYAFLTWQYLVGSLLFFLGGLFNYWRAYVVVRSEIAARQSAA